MLVLKMASLPQIRRRVLDEYSQQCTSVCRSLYLPPHPRFYKPFPETIKALKWMHIVSAQKN
jgi:hypothetical protein